MQRTDGWTRLGCVDAVQAARCSANPSLQLALRVIEHPLCTRPRAGARRDPELAAIAPAFKRLLRL